MQYISTWQHLVVVKISLHLPNTIQQDTVLTCLTSTCLHHHSLQDIHKSPDIFSPHKQTRTSQKSHAVYHETENVYKQTDATHIHRLGLQYISDVIIKKRSHSTPIVPVNFVLQKQFNYESRGYTRELQSNHFHLKTILWRAEGEMMLSMRMSCEWTG